MKEADLYKFFDAAKKVNRREFLKYTSIGAGGLIAGGCFGKGNKSADKEHVLFSFVQFNDTHVNLSGGYAAPNAGGEKIHPNAKFKSVIETINSEKYFPKPDFVILIGDIINGGKKEVLQPELEKVKQMLTELKCPYYTVMGNHENIQNQGNPEFEQAYKQVMGKDRANYYFNHKGIGFICMNDTSGYGGGNKVSDERNAWLKEVLGKHRDEPKIIACHIPIVSVRDEPVLKESFGWATYKLIGDQAWDIIRSEKNVIAVISGHLHMTGAVKADGIYQIVTSGLASYPCHYAHYKVYRHRIEVKIYQVAKELVTPSTNLHGIPRYKHGFTDSTHKTPDEYVSGTSAEHEFTIEY